MVEQFLVHHGIKGQRWGFRRYQNYDGTLTAAGKKRLGYDSLNDQEYTIKKGTEGTRVKYISDYKVQDVLDMSGYGSKAYKDTLKKANKDLTEIEKTLDTKYLSMDTTKENGKLNGTDYYAQWFSDGGWEGDKVSIDTYITNKDIKVAPAKKVVDEILKEYGNENVENLLKKNKTARLKTITLEYTNDKEFFDKVNKNLRKYGYDAIEDVNDTETINPIIFLSAVNDLSLRKTTSYDKYVKEKEK